MKVLEVIFSNPIVAFVILVGVVVFVHELGHYLVGRALGIEVEEFSLGFGPRAVGFRRGNTDYRISWLPLGGYVRFYGAEIGKEIPLEKREQSILTAKLYKRFLVSLAGPGANFVLSLSIMIVLSAVGLPQPAPVISVIPGSVAEQAGFKTGDTILKVGEKDIRTWGDFNKAISQSAGQELRVQVSHEGSERSVIVTPKTSEIETAYGDEQKVGRIGVTQYMMTPDLIVASDSEAYKAGLRSGDIVLSADGKSVRYFYQVQELLERGGELKVLHAPVGASLETLVQSSYFTKKHEPASAVALLVPPLERDELLKISSTDLSFLSFESLRANDKRTPALSALRVCNFQVGDTFVGFNGARVRNPVQLSIALEALQKSLFQSNSPTANLQFDLLSYSGVQRHAACDLPLRHTKDALNRDASVLDFPLQFVTHGVALEPVIVQSNGLVASLWDGVRAVGEQSTTIFTGIRKLVTGHVPLSNLGGPIAIAKVAGDAAQGGLLVFVLTISWMSVNIGMFNLLPLPALDGGTLLLQVVEAAYGRPLPTKVQEGVQRLGIALILLLIVVVFYNDILRLFHS